jgi:hypothetical protein
MEIKNVLQVEIVNVLGGIGDLGRLVGTKWKGGDASMILRLVESRCGKIRTPFCPWVGDVRTGSEFGGRYCNGIASSA